jgi:hypothetical protein
MDEVTERHSLPARWLPASRKRRLLAVYLDFIIFGVAWAFVRMALYALLPELRALDLPLRILAFALVEAILYKLFSWSPGNWLLSVQYVDMRVLLRDYMRKPGKKAAIVDAEVKQGESWLTLLTGVMLMNEGLKSIVRWTMWTPAVPLFGYETGPELSAVCLMAMGFVECSIAFLIFKLRKFAFLTSMVYFSGVLASVALSWNLWDPWVEEMVYRRRAYQGIPVREGEVEFMQTMTPELFLTAIALYVILLFLIRKRLSRKPA